MDFANPNRFLTGDRLTPGYFSIISELVIRLWGRLEQEGHVMADFAEDGAECPDVRRAAIFGLAKGKPSRSRVQLRLLLSLDRRRRISRASIR